jgi:L-ascorbate metabolism protein UlaG (beta-lactamase superfamily)
MSDKTLYCLKESTAAEPLVNSWSAWSHVVSPIASSLHLQKYQLDILQAYLEDPTVHVKACQDPQMRSGRFVDIPAERAQEVRDLLHATEIRQGHNLRLAQSLFEFHNQLVAEARGLSLEPFYRRLPPELRGYVELLYDYYNRPTVRFIERLLYESPYYDKGLQSMRLFRQRHDNSRPFFMSTPRLPSPEQLDWAEPFESSRIDAFFRLDSSPLPLGEIREILDLKTSDDTLLLSLLSEGPARTTPAWEGERVRLRYFGHACVLVEWKGVSILTDPCLGVVPSEGGIERFSYQDLPEKIDYVLVTHNHHDHYCLETLLRLRRRIGCLVVPRSFGIFHGDLSLKLLSRKLGFGNVMELDTLESISLPDGEVIGVPFLGEHADLPHAKSAYVVRAGQEQILFAADSDCLDQQLYEHLRNAIGPITTVFIGMECVGAPLSWSGGPFLPTPPTHSVEQSRRYKGADSTGAMEILDAVGARRLYIYAMGMEPWLEHLLGLAYQEDATQLKEAKLLLSKARARGIVEAKLLVGKAEIHLTNLPDDERALPRRHEREANRPLSNLSGNNQSKSKGQLGESGMLEEQLAYWKEQLRPPLNPLDLPTDRPRSDSHSYRGATHRFTLERTLTQGLRVYSRSQGVTLYMTLLGALQSLLYRYTGEEDVRVGTAVANRGRAETGQVMGCFINTMVIRTRMGGNPRFEEVMKRVREGVLGGEEHSEVGYEAVLEAVMEGEEGERARQQAAPLFQVWFAMQSALGHNEDLPESGLTPVKTGDMAARTDFNLILMEDETELRGQFDYNAELFDAETIEEMAQRYTTLLECVAAGIECGVLDLPLGEAEMSGQAATTSAMEASSEAADNFTLD